MRQGGAPQNWFLLPLPALAMRKLRVVLRWALVSGFQLAPFSISTFWFWAAMARPCTEGIEPILWRPCLESFICAIEHQ